MIIGYFMVTFDCLMKIQSGKQFEESGPMYQKTGRQVEKLTELLFFVIVKILPQCLVVLKCVTRYFVYFTSDFNNDAFELPFPMW